MDYNDKKNISGGIFADVKEDFQVRSATASVGFETEDAPPPFGTYIGVDDQVLIECASAVLVGPVTVNFRILRPDGIIVPFPVTVNMAGTRAFSTARFQLLEGWILSAAATSGQTITTGAWAYLSVAIQRTPFGANSQYELLMAGYLNSAVPMSYPTSVPQRPTDGPGTYMRVNIPAPGAGADQVYVVPAGARQRIVSWVGTLNAGVVVANRTPLLIVDDGVNIVAAIPSNQTVTASSQLNITFADSIPFLPPFATLSLGPLPSNLILPPGFRIRTQTAGIQAADQWQASNMLVAEWLENS